jgi:hypothetical protein
MTDSNTPQVDVNTDDLDAFSDLLHGKAVVAQAEDTTPEDVDTLAPENDEVPEDKPTDTEEDDDLPVDEKPVEKPKSRFQERIDELTDKWRTTEREKEDAKRKLDEALARLDALEKPPTESVAKTAPTQDDDGPRADDLNADGSDKYPLGEFDPAYIRDLTRHTIQKETERAKAAEAEAAERTKAERAQQELIDTWTDKLEQAKTEYPDIYDTNRKLLDAFKDVDPSYGDYLATTIMQMDAGPAVLYYLGNNLDEAREIVNAGALRATLALGKLEAKLASDAPKEKTTKPIKLSTSPEPPPITRGTNSGTKVLRGDTDNLDEFEALFYNKRK